MVRGRNAPAVIRLPWAVTVQCHRETTDRDCFTPIPFQTAAPLPKLFSRNRPPKDKKHEHTTSTTQQHNTAAQHSTTTQHSSTQPSPAQPNTAPRIPPLPTPYPIPPHGTHQNNHTTPHPAPHHFRTQVKNHAAALSSSVSSKQGVPAAARRDAARLSLSS